MIAEPIFRLALMGLLPILLLGAIWCFCRR
jgi:hypothetical protein